MRPTLSIIIPFFNPGQYFYACLESIVNQIDDCCKLILIDDGSSDDSSDVAAYFVGICNNIKLISCDRNNGVSHARNIGLNYANSDYVWFIDADDTVEKNAISSIIREIQGGYDLYLFWAREVMSDDKKSKIIKTDSPIGRYRAPLLPLSLGAPLYLWNHIIKTSIARSTFFNEDLRICEDRDYLFRIYSIANSLVISNYVIYNYLRRKGSASSRVSFDEMLIVGLLDIKEHDAEIRFHPNRNLNNAITKRAGEITRLLMRSSPSKSDIHLYKRFMYMISNRTNFCNSNADYYLSHLVARLPNTLIYLIGRILS